MAALNELIASLDSRDIEKLFERYHFTESQKLEIAKEKAMRTCAFCEAIWMI